MPRWNDSKVKCLYAKLRIKIKFRAQGRLVQDIWGLFVWKARMSHLNIGSFLLVWWRNKVHMFVRMWALGGRGIPICHDIVSIPNSRFGFFTVVQVALWCDGASKFVLSLGLGWERREMLKSKSRFLSFRPSLESEVNLNPIWPFSHFRHPPPAPFLRSP